MNKGKASEQGGSADAEGVAQETVQKAEIKADKKGEGDTTVTRTTQSTRKRTKWLPHLTATTNT